MGLTPHRGFHRLLDRDIQASHARIDQKINRQSGLYLFVVTVASDRTTTVSANIRFAFPGCCRNTTNRVATERQLRTVTVVILGSLSPLFGHLLGFLSPLGLCFSPLGSLPPTVCQSLVSVSGLSPSCGSFVNYPRLFPCDSAVCLPHLCLVPLIGSPPI